MFWTGTKCIQIFGLAQHILDPVEGQGINQNSINFETVTRNDSATVRLKIQMNCGKLRFS